MLEGNLIHNIQAQEFPDTKWGLWSKKKMVVTSLQLIRAEIKKSTKTIPYFLCKRTFILNYRKYSSVSEFKRYLSNKEV